MLQYLEARWSEQRKTHTSRNNSIEFKEKKQSSLGEYSRKMCAHLRASFHCTRERQRFHEEAKDIEKRSANLNNMINSASLLCALCLGAENRFYIFKELDLDFEMVI